MVEDGMSQIDTVLHRALDGDALLFVGAGVSHLSIGEGGEKVPSGATLTARLNENLGIYGRHHPLDRISGHYVRTMGSGKLYDILRESLVVADMDQVLKLFYCLDWRRIYTTNFDDAIEFARKDRLPRSFTLKDAPAKVSKGSIIHLNGYIRNVAPHNIVDDLTLTDVSYAVSNLARSPWAQYFKSDIRLSRAVIFIGYSLADLDIERLLLEDPGISGKTIFIVGPESDQVDVSSMSRYGKVYTGGVDLLFARLTSVIGDYVPQPTQHHFHSMRDLQDGDQSSDQRSAPILVFEQLVYGKAPLFNIMKGELAFDNCGFLVEREAVTEALGKIKRGVARDVIITGGIASGKSFAALQIARHYYLDGYRVFWVRDSRSLRVDLEHAIALDDKICVVFDDYHTYVDDIKWYAEQRPIAHQMILTERSVIHEIMFDATRSVVDPSKLLEINLDKIMPLVS